MTALEIEGPDGQTRRMIVRRPGDETLRRNPRAAQNEFQLLHVTHAWGLATPTPYHLDPSGRIFPTPYLVIEYIEGEPEFAPYITEHTIRESYRLFVAQALDSLQENTPRWPSR
jgi:aminoglycoside phosphotransferase (APT) family kinase protein